MNTLRFGRMFVIVLVAALAVLPASPASADPPTFETLPLAATFEYPAGSACAFPVRGEITGWLNIQHHLDSDGDLVFDRLTFVHWSATYTNVDTGKSLFTAGPEPVKINYNDDGTVVAAHMGLSLHVVDPGRGLVHVQVGRLVALITRVNGRVVVLDLLFEAGRHDTGYAAALCEALEG